LFSLFSLRRAARRLGKLIGDGLDIAIPGRLINWFP